MCGCGPCGRAAAGPAAAAPGTPGGWAGGGGRVGGCAARVLHKWQDGRESTRKGNTAIARPALLPSPPSHPATLAPPPSPHLLLLVERPLGAVARRHVHGRVLRGAVRPDAVHDHRPRQLGAQVGGPGGGAREVVVTQLLAALWWRGIAVHVENRVISSRVRNADVHGGGTHKALCQRANRSVRATCLIRRFAFIPV